MLIPLAMTALLSSPAQDALTSHLATSSENLGVAAVPSLDGAIVYQARGPRVHELDFAYMRANIGAAVGSELWDDAAAGPATSYFLNTSITALVDSGPVLGTVGGGRYLWVGAGDEAVVRIDRQTGSVPAGGSADHHPTGGKWVFDLESDPEAGLVYAILGAKDQSELWVFDALTGAQTATFDLTAANGYPSGTALGIALEEYSLGVVFLALGEGGVVRVDTSLSGPAAVSTIWQVPAGAVPQTHRARDVSMGRSRLFVAAEREGLLSIDLPNFTGPGTATIAVQPAIPGEVDQHYPVRVDASVDPVTGDEVIVVGGATKPSLLHEWGNYVSYGNFDEDLAPLGISGIPQAELDELEFKSQDQGAFFVYTQERGAPTLVEREALQTGSDSVENAWRTLDVQVLGGSHWVLDNDVTLRRFDYDKFDADMDGEFSTLADSGEAFWPDSQDHTLAIPSQLEPNFILAGHDGDSAGHYAVNGTSTSASVDLIAGTDSDPFFIGLFGQETWLAESQAVEWGGVQSVDGASEQEFGLIRFQPNLAGGFLWDYWRVDMPEDPITMEIVRGYRTIASRFEESGGDDLLALCMTAVPTSVALYRPSALMAAAGLGSTSYLPDGHKLVVDPFDQLLVHDEVLGTSYDGKLSAYRSQLFEWVDPGTQTTRLVLAMAAGSLVVQTSPGVFERQEPKLAFFDLDDCRSVLPPSGHCGAAVDPGNPMGLAYEPERRRIALGDTSLPDAEAFGVEVATVDGVQLAFSANTDGSVSAYDLRSLFQATAQPALVEEARWQMSDSVFDGAPVPCTDVLHRVESLVPGGPLEDVLYVAGNRRGVIRLQVDVVLRRGGVLDVIFTELETINTPGQPTGLALGSMDLGGPASEEALIVSDHGSAGIKIYVSN